MKDPAQQVEVVYAVPERQMVVPVDWYKGLTVERAVQQSGLLRQFPEITLHPDRVGVFGERQPLDHVLEPGDRVELYRPLEMTPTAARRLRAETRKKAR